jgi:hypothetical protein
MKQDANWCPKHITTWEEKEHEVANGKSALPSVDGKKRQTRMRHTHREAVSFNVPYCM